METRQLQETVIHTIQQDLDIYTDLHELLESQQKQLLSRDHQSLSQSAERMTGLLLEARENRKTRSRAMNELGLENTQSGMETFLQQLHRSNKSELLEDWEELMELVAECRQINQINEQTLKLQKELTETVLKQAQVESRGGQTYSSSGQETTAQRSMLDIKA